MINKINFKILLIFKIFIKFNILIIIILAYKKIKLIKLYFKI